MGSDIAWNFGTEIRRLFWSNGGRRRRSFVIYIRNEGVALRRGAGMAVPEWIWDAFGVVWGYILGSKTDIFGNSFEGIRKTVDFRKLARRAGERLVLGDSRRQLERFWGPKIDENNDRISDGSSGPKFGRYFGPKVIHVRVGRSAARPGSRPARPGGRGRRPRRRPWNQKDPTRIYQRI